MKEDFFKKKIKSGIRRGKIGREIIFFDSTSSTNIAALKIGEERADTDGIVVVSDSQTKGRGRLGRRWESPAGVNLYFTILLKPSFSPADAPLLTMAAAVSCASAISDFTGLKAGIKWPNDLIVNGKKAGGILLEMKTGNESIKYVAIGIGINVNMGMDILPDDIRPFSTSLSEKCGREIDRAGLFDKVLSVFEGMYESLLKGERAPLFEQWNRLNVTTGKEISVETGNRVVTGIAEGIDERGGLIVKLPSGGREVVSAGDVTVLKKR
ncbi:MAG: biotin--[acetyl-CoA-carboxylase] ligase [Nitrospirae bacterium]|nr:biotin--[acetyl-CoA-carboxylase] ligase [Nitrospirota bacterium]